MLDVVGVQPFFVQPFVGLADKKEFLILAMQTNDLKVRQAVAEFTEEIPAEFKTLYETLLDDASYDTKEIAFMNLWKNFPERIFRI